MSFRDEVNNTTKTVMIETFIASLFSNPHRRFGDIIEDLIDVDDPDDDWMRETLFDLEIGQIVKAGMKVMKLGSRGEERRPLPQQAHASMDGAASFFDESEDEPSDDSHADEDDENEEEEGASDSDDDVDHHRKSDEGPKEEVEIEEPEEDEPKKKKKKKKIRSVVVSTPKKKKKTNDAPPIPPKKKKKKKPEAVLTKSKGEDEVEGAKPDPEWVDYLKLIVKAMRSHKAYDSETAINNGTILDNIHGENGWDKDEAADLRRGMDELINSGKTGKVGQRRGTKYHLV